MSALDKFYDFTLNLPDAKLTSKAMSLCNIDRNVFNIYLTLQEGKNNPILNADLGDYTVTMIVVKPKTKEYVEKIGVVDGSNDRLLFELGDTFNDQIGSYKGEIKVQNGNEVITSSSFAYTVTQSLISGLNAEIEASPDVEILRQLINEVKAVVGMTPGDPDSLLTDYQKKNDNTLITTDKTIIGAINENSSQIKHIANKVPNNKEVLETITTEKINKWDSNSGGSSITIKDIFANNELPRIYMTSDRLGLLSNKNDTEADCECEIKINNETIKCFATGKVQGTTSAGFPGKNFTFKFYADREYSTKQKIDVGWGEQYKYCFKKNWVDTTHTRNLSGARIAYDMVESRPKSEFKTSLQTSPRNGVVDGFPCKLYINGEFWGLYTWNIPKDDWMFNMDSDNPNNMVLCAEKNNNGSSSADDILQCEFRKLWDGNDGSSWSIEVGTFTDKLKNSFNRCVDFVMTSTDAEFHDNINQYFDLYSLIDYYLFSYFVAHIDGLGKNMLMATYDGIIWGACLYDMDSIYGADWNGANFKNTNIPCPNEYQETNSLLWQRIETCFIDELKARYAELRKGALSLGNIVTHVEEIYDLIPERIFNDDQSKWTGLPSKTTNTITRFRNYMRDRAVYVDEQINNLTPPVDPISCTNITLSTNMLTFTDTTPQTLIATVEPTDTTDSVVWSVSPSGIARVNNGLVTPRANGDCVVTVTCGSQTDTCSVSISGIEEVRPSKNLVFKVDSTCMDTSSNTLTDSVAGISATLIGNPTVSNEQIVFTESDKFNFNISSLGLTNNNRTLRIKFILTALDSNTRNVFILGQDESWASSTTSYMTSSVLKMQHGLNGFSNNTVGDSVGQSGTNRLPTTPTANREYEIVISENIDGNVRWFVDGTLVQNGETTHYEPLILANTEGSHRFVGAYSLIEIYNEYCDTYAEFTNMINV